MGRCFVTLLGFSCIDYNRSNCSKHNDRWINQFQFERDKTMNTYKRRMLIFAIGIIVVIGLFVWGNVSHRNIDSLPSLAEVAQMEDEAELNSYITNFTKSELKVVWGKPNESSTTEDVWYINDNTKLVVNYHNNDDKAVICGIVRTN